MFATAAIDSHCRSITKFAAELSYPVCGGRADLWMRGVSESAMLSGMAWKLALIIGALGFIMLLGSAYLNRRARRARDSRPVDTEALRSDVVAALAREDLAEAVSIYRQRTNAGLLEATDAVRRIDRDRR
jgi:hypothetical protein